MLRRKSLWQSQSWRCFEHRRYTVKSSTPCRESLVRTASRGIALLAALPYTRRHTSSIAMLDFGDDVFGGLDGSSGGFGSQRGGGGRPEPKVPVSIISGFLGAGKTTMVQHILQNREGLKVGVVVNDVAEANVDSEVLTFSEADGIVGLQNGCACCSGRDDLFTRLQELAESTGISKLERRWDRLVVECSGVAEPESIASELEAMGKRGHPLMKRVFLAGIICLVDASTFWDSYNSADAGSEDGGRIPLSRLLLSQVEAADTIIINKLDLVSQTEIDRLSVLLKALNSTARLLVSTRGAIPLRTLLPAEPVDIDMPAYVPSLANRHSVAVRGANSGDNGTVPASGHDGHSHTADDGHGSGHGHGRADNHDDGHAPSHSHGHSHSHSHSHSHGEDGSALDCAVCATQEAAARHERYGLRTFVYRNNDGLFDADQLSAVVRQLPVVCAEIGFAEASPEAANRTVADAGTSKTFAGVLRSKGFVRLAENEAQAYYWSHAGRRLELQAAPGKPPCKGQEIVFIGAGMDQNGIVRALDACLAKL